MLSAKFGRGRRVRRSDRLIKTSSTDSAKLMSFGEGAGTDFATMRGRSYPTIRQFTVFLENRVGQLLEVVRRFEGSKVRIVALSINISAITLAI